MNPWVRALLGAAVGSLITLFLHPASRPFMTGVAARADPALVRHCIDANASALQPPTTLAEASLWMQLAAHRIINRKPLAPKERATVLMIARRASEKDRPNAFWPLMEAILYCDGGHVQKAMDAWMRASACATWDDYQSQRLLAARDAIARQTGVRQSWQLAYLYYVRSEDVAIGLRSVAHTILSRADYNTVAGLTIRYATLLDGDLIRRYAHTTNLSVAGMDIIDLATYPSESMAMAPGTPMSPKKLWSGQLAIIANLTQILHEPDWSDRASEIFKAAESWRALTVHDTNEEQTEILALSSVVSASVAGAIVVVAVIGLGIWYVGKLVSWRLATEKDVKPVVAACVALGLGGLAQALTGYWPAAIASALCAAFLIVAPDRSRKARPNNLGPMFEFVSMLLGLICSALFVAYLVGTTLSANAVFPSLGVPSEFLDSPLFAGLAAVSFGLVLLVAPIWAVVHRLGTPHVLSLILMRFGRFVALAGLTLSIVLGPLSVYADRRLDTTFTELVKNEPVHYWVHQ